MRSAKVPYIQDQRYHDCIAGPSAVIVSKLANLRRQFHLQFAADVLALELGVLTFGAKVSGGKVGEDRANHTNV
jgi:hypothetical protein